MKILVGYKSKTGFAKRYGEVIARELEGDLVTYKNLSSRKMSEYDVVIYGGGLYAGRVNGLSKVKEMFANSNAKMFVLYATGATPNEVVDKIEEVWNQNLSIEEREKLPHFYMQGGICYESMGFADKTLMKLMAKVLSKKQDKDSNEEGMALAISKSYDIFSKEYAKLLISYVKGVSAS